MLAAALGRFLQVATLTAKLGWSEERGTVFSLNVALNLALVPSDAPVCPHTSPGSRLWTVGPPIPLSFLPLPPPPPILTLIPQPGAKTQNLNIGHTPSTPQSTCAQFGCHQYCPPRTGQASFTQYWVSLLGTPPPVSFPLPMDLLSSSSSHPLFGCVSVLPPLPRVGRGAPRVGPLNHTSCPSWKPGLAI